MEREMEEAQRVLAKSRVVSERRQTSHKIAQPGYTKSVRSSMRSFGLWICEGICFKFSYQIRCVALWFLQIESYK